MHSLNLPFDAASSPKILCLGAHSDDIEIGCGAAILRLARQYPNCLIHWVVFSALGVRAAEAQRGATLFAGRNVQEPLLKEFQDGFMPFMGREVKALFEQLKSFSPDLVFTHHRNDAHQDERRHDRSPDEQLGGHPAFGAAGGVLMTTLAPGKSRAWPSVTTRSPVLSPCTMTVSCCSRARPTATGRDSTVRSGLTTKT